MIADDEFEELPDHEPTWAAFDRITIYRKQLLASGYSPVPVNGKRVHLDDWQNITCDERHYRDVGDYPRGSFEYRRPLPRYAVYRHRRYGRGGGEQIEALLESELETAPCELAAAEARHSVSSRCAF